MRYHILIVLLLCMSWGAQAHTTHDHSNILPPKDRKKKRPPKVGNQFGLALPGWLIRLGLNAVVNPNNLDKEEMELFDKVRPLLRRLSGVRFLMTDYPEASRKVKRLRKRFLGPRSRQRTQTLVKVRDGSTHVNVAMQIKRRKRKTVIRKLVIWVEDDGEMVAVVIKGRWNTKTIRKVIKDINFSTMGQALIE